MTQEWGPPKIHPFFIGDHDMDVDEQGKANLDVNEKKRPLTPESNKDEQPKSKVGKLVHLPQASYRHRGRLGQSKSTIWARLQNEKFQRGKLNAADSSLARFATKILALDRNAVIVDSKTVRHIKCGKHLTMKAPFDIGNFRTHVQKCAGPPKSAKLSGAGMLPFDAYFKNNTRLASAQPKEPCPGLDETVYPEIAAYLNRTGAHGGGASSVTVIAEEMYGKHFVQLSDARKKAVKTAQQHEWKWTNNHETGKVFATRCSKLASPRSPQLRSSSSQNHDADNGLPKPCQFCCAVLSMKKFKNACRVPQPPDSRYKFLNTAYRGRRISSIFGRCVGLRQLFEDDVSVFYS